MRPQEPEQRSVRTVTLSDPRVVQPSMQRSYLVPSSTTAKPGESEALDVLAHVLGSGTTSRLYQTLVVERGVAISVSAWYQDSALDLTRFGFSGSPKPGTTLEQLGAAIDAVIADVLDKGVTAEEIERAKVRLIADAVFAQDSQSTLARWYGSALTTGLTVEKIKTWPSRIRAVTPEAVRDAARAWLDKRRSVTGYLIKGEARPEEKRS
jgi:zinc protease